MSDYPDFSESPPTMDDVATMRAQAEQLYAHARRLMASDHFKSAVNYISLAQEAEEEADRRELLALRAIVAAQDEKRQS